MKLIKLNTDHYIIVDDSKINNGDVHFDFDKNEIDIWEGNLHSNRFKCKKITHSTQPLGDRCNGICNKIVHDYSDEATSCTGVCEMLWGDVQEMSISEVKELIGEVDVEKMIEVEFNKFQKENPIIPNSYFNPFKLGVLKGYNQALEDNKDRKYTENDVLQIVEKSRETGLTAEYLIMTLQPKTEWEVEIVDGKLKLK